jgi:hypothetical protein
MSSWHGVTNLEWRAVRSKFLVLIKRYGLMIVSLAYGCLIGVIPFFTHRDELTPLLFEVVLIILIVYSLFKTAKSRKALKGRQPKRLTRAFRISNGAMLLFFLLHLGFRFALSAWFSGPNLLSNSLMALLAVGYLCLLPYSLLLAPKQTHTGLIVLWLRRFHRPKFRGASFPILLGGACSGLATPVTLQDETYAYSPHSRRAGTTRSLPIFLLCAAIAALGIIPILNYIHRIGPLYVAMSLWACGTFTALFFLRSYVKRRTGAYRVGARDPMTQLAKLLDTLRARRRSATLGGVAVIKVSDEIWQAAVRAILKSSAAAIIDASDLNENLRWEIRTAVAHLSPRNIVIAYSLAERESEQEGVTAVRSQLAALLGEQDSIVFPLFFYPEQLGKRRLFSPPPNLCKSLQDMLRALLDPEAVPGKDVATTTEIPSCGQP